MRTTTLTVKQGDTWNVQFAWKNNNSPINLTDCLGKMQIRNRAGDLLGEVSSAHGITIDGISGVVSVSFPASITSTITPGTYNSDLQLTFPVTGQVQSSSTIQFIVQEDITK